MHDLETIKRLNGEQPAPRLAVEVVAGIVSIEEGIPVSRVRRIIAETQPVDIAELRQIVRAVKPLLTDQTG